MPKETKKTTTKATRSTTPPPLDIGLPKSGLLSTKKSMDIVPKSKTMPSSSAKPIIVSNRTIVKDPMSPPELTDTPKVIDTTPRPKSSSKIVITPLHTDLESNDANTKVVTKTASENVQTDEPTDATLLATSGSAESTSKPDQEDKLIEDENIVEAAGSDSEAREKNEAAQKTGDFLGGSADETAEDIKKSTEPKPEELERKRAEEVAELIESQQYFLPINAVKKRRSAYASWLILLVLLGGIGVLALLDAGILTFTAAPTDFIPN